MAKQDGLVSSRYSPDDAEDCLGLLAKVWGDSELAAPAYHDWQCQRSPAGAAVASLAREKETGGLVGQVVTIPINVRLSGKVHTAGLSLNPVVDPGYENGDIFVSLMRDVCAFSAEAGIAFSYGFPDQPSYSTFVNKAGFRDIGSVPLLIRPLNPKRLALKATNSLVLGKTASIARRIWRTPVPAPRQEIPPDLEIAEVDSFDDSFGVFWDRIQHRFPVMVVRDPAYLNWRFSDAPTREYMTFAGKSDGKIRGFAVLRVAPLGRFSAGLIVDLVVEASAEGRLVGRLLIDQACSYSKEHDLDLVASLALRHTDEFRLLRSRGFWVCPKFLQPQPYRLVVRCHDEEASPSRLAHDLRNWFVTMGDYDAV
ncbi:MAG: GNAT family N-acetyltransferase [Dehalococcoidia bacterium]|nr:MAG: GNAT family N-acetyltransferase [Dehalococcoidia bacterium]